VVRPFAMVLIAACARSYWAGVVFASKFRLTEGGAWQPLAALWQSTDVLKKSSIAAALVGSGVFKNR
jgi:hypothetical protein